MRRNATLLVLLWVTFGFWARLHTRVVHEDDDDIGCHYSCFPLLSCSPSLLFLAAQRETAVFYILAFDVPDSHGVASYALVHHQKRRSRGTNQSSAANSSRRKSSVSDSDADVHKYSELESSSCITRDTKSGPCNTVR